MNRLLHHDPLSSNFKPSAGKNPQEICKLGTSCSKCHKSIILAVLKAWVQDTHARLIYLSQNMKNHNFLAKQGKVHICIYKLNCSGSIHQSIINHFSLFSLNLLDRLLSNFRQASCLATNYQKGTRLCGDIRTAYPFVKAAHESMSYVNGVFILRYFHNSGFFCTILRTIIF